MTRATQLSDTTVATLRVAIYLRISTDEAHQPFSLEAQRHRLGAFIESQPGWTQTAVYEDQVSGAKASRPALDQALADAKAGRFDVLLVYRVDRFARSLKVLVGLLDELDKAGVAFRSATEPIDTATPTGRMLVQLLGVFAEFERATIIDRVIAGMERKAARGHWPGGTLPYGLATDDDKRLVAVESELTVVRSIFERYAAGDIGVPGLAAELNASGLRTKAGRPWSGKVVTDVLRNRSYLGEVYFRGTWHYSADPFLDVDLFDRVQVLLGGRGDCHRTRAQLLRPDYLLTGLVKCSRCQSRYVGVSSKGKQHRYRYYLCWTRSRYGITGCDAERLRADELEDAVIDQLVDLYREPAVLREAIDAERETSKANSRARAEEIAAIDADIRKAERSVERYMLAFEKGSLAGDSFAGRLDGLTRTIAALNARRDTLTAAAARDPTTPADDDLAAIAAQLRHTMDDAPDTLRKAVTQAFVVDLTVDSRDAIQPRYRALTTRPDDDATGVRTQEPLVGAEGLEPPTPSL